MPPFDRMPPGFDRRTLLFVPEAHSKSGAIEQDCHRAGRSVLRSQLWLLFGLSFFLAATSFGQTFGARGIKGFKIAEPYGPPHETQIKSVLEGGMALPLTGGMILFSNGVILRHFSETNTLQMVVRASQCLYDSTNHLFGSAGPIQMQTADGRFTIEGEGFYVQQTNSSLVISNKVHTTILGELLQAQPTKQSENPAKPNTDPLTIWSGRFNYDGVSHKGVWRDNVSLTGTNLALRSAVLTAEVPISGQQVRSLLAETNVILDYAGLHATGSRLTYAPDNGLVRMSDQATWQSDQREGYGDELVVDRTNRIFQVNGHAWLKLPGQALGETGFLSSSNSPSNKSANPPKGSVEIFCDSYEIRTNWATFRDKVRLEERLDNQVRSRMACNLMTVTFTGTNEFQTMIAEKDVTIEQLENKKYKKLTGGRAIYTHTNSILEMTQNPTWQDELHKGQGDLLRLNTQLNEMLVRGNASLRSPANELAGQFSPTTAGGTTNRPVRTGTNEFADVFCQEYTLRPDRSLFLGGVYLTHPEMNLSCEKLAVRTPGAGATNLVAEQNVVFDLMTEKGKVHGTGDNAIYSFGVFNTVTNGILPINELRLTGSPAILSSTNGTFPKVWNQLIIWDRANDNLTLPGDYKIQGDARPMDTNIFVLPNKKLRK